MDSQVIPPTTALEWVKYKFHVCANTYRQLIVADPTIAGHLENVLKGASYVIPGASEEMSELIYAFSNILAYLHDALLKHAAGLPLWMNISPLCRRLQVFLAVLEQVEVFLELVSSRYSIVHRWITVTLIVLSKTLLRLVLLHQRPALQTWPIIKPMNRQNCPTSSQAASSSEQSTDASRSEPTSASSTAPLGQTYVWQGRRMGRVLRSLRDPAEDNPSQHQSLSRLLSMSSPLFNAPRHTLAEVIYTVRPLIHFIYSVLWVLRNGFMSWKPWLLSVIFDTISLHLHYSRSGLTTEERSELSRRMYMFFFYLIRSPCYNDVSKEYIIGFLERCTQSFTPIAVVAKTCLDYLPTWQRTYFYTWLS